ncbi:MAG: hypothetical protein ABI741_00110 [Ferruginibacter sp.]
MQHRIQKSLLLGCLLLFTGACSFAQTGKIEALKKDLAQAHTAQEKVVVLIQICEQQYSLPPDVFLEYITLVQSMVKPGTIEYFRARGFYSTYLSKIDKVDQALALNDSLLLSIPQEKEFETLRNIIYLSRCNLLIRNNQPKDAIEQSLKLLEDAEQVQDTLRVLRTFAILGWANMELEQYSEAVKWLRLGHNYTNDENILRQSSYLYSNMASSYNDLHHYDSAFYFIALGVRYSREDENLSVVANALNIRADIYINTGNLAAAENDMKAALKVREQIGDMLYVISDMAQLSSFYASTNQTDKGIEIAGKGVALARKTNNISKLLFLYNALAENYKKAGDSSKYAASLLSIIDLKDSLYKQNSGKAIAEMEAKYQLQKKENIIIRQIYELKQSRYTAIGFAVLLIAGLLFVWLLYRNYRLALSKKMEMAMAEQKLLSYKAVELAEENERKRIAANLHDNLGSYAAAITTNVKNLKEGNNSGADTIMAQLDDNAQNMVTQLSDTIWVLKNEQLPITKLADRFKVWTQRLIQNYPEVKYHYTEHIVEDIEFTPTKILHIFLILKECVNNALKHSDCTDLVINFFSEKAWVISIEDNGKGFENNHADGGSGIDNIKNRAAECGWNVVWEDLKPSGTLVIISDTTTK